MSLPKGHLFPYDTPPQVLVAKTAGTFLVVPKRDVDACDVLPLVTMVSRWTESREALLAKGGRLQLVVDGYNADARDIDQVPEIRAYFEALEAAWPHLPLFLVADRPNQSLYWMMVGDGRRSPDGSERINFGNAKKAIAPQLRYFDESTRLLESFRVAPEDPEAQLFSRTLTVLAELMGNRNGFIRAIR